MAEEVKTSVIVAAGGSGSRMGESLPKQFLRLRQKPIIVYSLQLFESMPLIQEIIIVAPEQHMQRMHSLVDEYRLSKVTHLVPGGERRQDSVRAGLQAVSDLCELVLIHDGVRPFVTQDQVEHVIRKAATNGAAILAVPVTDTIKRAEKGVVTETLERTQLWRIQTPQGFNRQRLIEAYEKARVEGFNATDDAMVMENTGQSVQIVEGSSDNIKITRPEDLAIADKILTDRELL